MCLMTTIWNGSINTIKQSKTIQCAYYVIVYELWIQRCKIKKLLSKEDNHYAYKMTSNCMKSCFMMCENYVIFSLIDHFLSSNHQIVASKPMITWYMQNIQASGSIKENFANVISFTVYLLWNESIKWFEEFSTLFTNIRHLPGLALDKDDQFENKQPYITLKWDIFDVRFDSQLTLLSSWSHQRIPCLSFNPNLTLCILKICQETWMGICILCHSSTVKFTGYWFTHKKNKNITISHVQYHSCWWPGDVMSQGISSHDIDQDCWE